MTDLSAYRPNVGVVLFHGDGRVWLGRRANTPGPLNWQFPQGGVDAGEDLLAAARRELAEETGVTSITYLGRTDGWLTYDFPPEHEGAGRGGKWRGQRQVWFAFRFDGPEEEINLQAHGEPEFDSWKWAPLQSARDVVVPFKRPIYDAVIEAFSIFTA